MSYIEFFKHPCHLFFYLIRWGLLDNLSDVAYLKWMYRAYTGEKLNLKTPKPSHEKIQWKKLNNRKTQSDAGQRRTAGSGHMADINSVYDVVEQIDQLGNDRGNGQFKKELSHRCGGKLVGDIRLIQNDHNPLMFSTELLFV